jgi:transposase
MPHELLAWAAGLVEAGGTPGAMASPGEQWQPVSHLWEGMVTSFLVHASQVTNVPGPQTDPAAARWRAQRMRYGVLQARCLPPLAQRARRALTRSRTQLGQERARAVNRVQGVWERAHLTLAAVASAGLGVAVDLLT